VLRGALLDTFLNHEVFCGIICFFAELCSIGYTSFLAVLIGYIQEPEADIWRGVYILAIFATMMTFSFVLKNYYIFYGYMVAIKIRKTVIGALYDKITKLSIKSLTETNSGKLITIVSGDMQALERPLALIAMVIAAPFINIAAYIVMGLTAGWIYAAVTFGIWILMIICQHFAA